MEKSASHGKSGFWRRLGELGRMPTRIVIRSTRNYRWQNLDKGAAASNVQQKNVYSSIPDNLLPCTRVLDANTLIIPESGGPFLVSALPKMLSQLWISLRHSSLRRLFGKSFRGGNAREIPHEIPCLDMEIVRFHFEQENNTLEI